MEKVVNTSQENNFNIAKVAIDFNGIDANCTDVYLDPVTSEQILNICAASGSGFKYIQRLSTGNYLIAFTEEFNTDYVVLTKRTNFDLYESATLKFRQSPNTKLAGSVQIEASNDGLFIDAGGSVTIFANYANDVAKKDSYILDLDNLESEFSFLASNIAEAQAVIAEATFGWQNDLSNNLITAKTYADEANTVVTDEFNEKLASQKTQLQDYANTGDLAIYSSITNDVNANVDAAVLASETKLTQAYKAADTAISSQVTANSQAIADVGQAPSIPASNCTEHETVGNWDGSAWVCNPKYLAKGYIRPQATDKDYVQNAFNVDRVAFLGWGMTEINLKTPIPLNSIVSVSPNWETGNGNVYANFRVMDDRMRIVVHVMNSSAAWKNNYPFAFIVHN